jgi:NADH-quinone oxidoreductase subunit E
VQNEQGYLSAEGMTEVAEILALAPSEVQAVSTFYSMYFVRPSGEHHVLVCVNVSCALRGADEIVSHVERRLGCPSGGTSSDGKFTWESTVECLGACGGAPAMQVDHHFHEDLTPERVDAIIERVRSQPSPHGRPGAAATAASGPHSPTAETPPVAVAEGPPPDHEAGSGLPEAGASPVAEHTEMPGSRTKPTATPRAGRSRPRRLPRLDAGDL